MGGRRVEGVPYELSALPDPEDEFDARVLADIERYGWHCLHVADENHPEHAEENAALGPHPVYDAAFAYTVGLPLTLKHPELVLVGRWTRGHSILAQTVRLIEAGTRFAAGDTSDDILDGYPVRFGTVSDARRKELLTYADWAGLRRPFEALQLILPDGEGRWPDDPAYGAFPQPLLDRV